MSGITHREQALRQLRGARNSAERTHRLSGDPADLQLWLQLDHMVKALALRQRLARLDRLKIRRAA